MSIEVRPAYYTGCDFCREMWGPYRDEKEAKYEPTLDGWLITDTEVRCYACQDIDDDENEVRSDD